PGSDAHANRPTIPSGKLLAGDPRRHACPGAGPGKRTFVGAIWADSDSRSQFGLRSDTAASSPRRRRDRIHAASFARDGDTVWIDDSAAAVWRQYAGCIEEWRTWHDRRSARTRNTYRSGGCGGSARSRLGGRSFPHDQELLAVAVHQSRI